MGAALSRTIPWVAAEPAVSAASEGVTPMEPKDVIVLPKPRAESDVPVERALLRRRSVREFRESPLALDEVSQLVWAAQGITGPESLRTAPSAGALYPLEVYLVAGSVTGLKPGVYRYEPAGHRLASVAQGDRRAELARAALGQQWVRRAPATIVFAAVEARTTWKYGRRGIGYIYIEVGHAAQNVFLQGVALGLGAAVVGAFEEGDAAELLKLPKEARPLYLMPVGRPLREGR
jgi:SagB-type dehydrogenase family enzyme